MALRGKFPKRLKKLSENALNARNAFGERFGFATRSGRSANSFVPLGFDRVTTVRGWPDCKRATSLKFQPPSMKSTTPCRASTLGNLYRNVAVNRWRTSNVEEALSPLVFSLFCG